MTRITVSQSTVCTVRIGLDRVHVHVPCDGLSAAALVQPEKGPQADCRKLTLTRFLTLSWDGALPQYGMTYSVHTLSRP